MNDVKIEDRIEKLLGFLKQGLLERDEHIAMALLAVLSGHHVFLLGPPGTAKSMIARRLSEIFDGENYFECLINRFSTPDELFGPVSITKLKEDVYERKTKSYLPEADIAFLDEIWKGNPGILNALLTLMNERKFKNGAKLQNAKLKSAIFASNEIPQEGQGLDALYDRMLVRLYVKPIENSKNFEEFISQEYNSKPKPCENKITNDDLDKFKEEVDVLVEISREAHEIIHLIRKKLNKENIYVSDRRWKASVNLMKAATYFSGHDEIRLCDILILRHCLWSGETDKKETSNEEENQTEREIVKEIVEESIMQIGLSSMDNTVNVDDLREKKNELSKTIDKTFYRTVLQTVNGKTIQGKACLEFNDEKKLNDLHGNIEVIYIPLEGNIDTNNDFYPIDENGVEIRGINCNFNDGKICTLEHRPYRTKCDIEVKTSRKKGAFNENASNNEIVDFYKEKVNKLRGNFEKFLTEIENKQEKVKEQQKSVFVSKVDMKNIILESITKQITDINKNITEVEEIAGKIDKAVAEAKG